jgi:hypothetical protein
MLPFLSFDGIVNSQISALRFSVLSLRRTGSTPHSTHLTRLELGFFTTPSMLMAFCEYGLADGGRAAWPPSS